MAKDAAAFNDIIEGSAVGSALIPRRQGRVRRRNGKNFLVEWNDNVGEIETLTRADLLSRYTTQSAGF